MARKNRTSESYFQAHQRYFDLWGGLKNSKGFRECQLGAYWAVWSHFTATNEPALVSLPTGAGKTALMMALSFGLKANRILIITPAQVLGYQTAKEFESLDVLIRIGTLRPVTAKPKACFVENKLQNPVAWRRLAEYDVVTATPKTTSPREDGVCNPPPGLFDLVFLDEAHHAPAPTWAAILKAFKGTKCILLTATPFRRDKRRIRASLIYHYSIGRALESGIYRPVEYVAVDGGNNRSVRDKALCEKAKKVLALEKRKGNSAKLLIRADRVEWADRLTHLYGRNGIRVKAVDYTKPWAENQAVIQAVRNDKLDGMVCVGMLGEGLDLPELKIAVLHAAPRSLPFTLQFVGRVSRFSGKQTGDAYLLSVPDEVRGEVRRLHKSDANWRKLIPKLVDEVIGKVSEMRHFKSPYAFEEFDINPLDLKPFFSVRVYAAGLRQIDFEAEINLPDNVGICFRESLHNTETFVLITEHEDEPAWAKETGILETRFDLHVYYYSERTKLLFEATTSDIIARDIRSGIAGDQIERITPEEIMRVLQEGDAGSYFMVGLKNAIGRGPSQPSYKTVMGMEVEAAVRPTDGKVFAPGHALIQLNEEETRGIGALQSRVWAIKRDNLDTFQEWCAGLAAEIKKNHRDFGLPQLRFLISSEDVSEIPERPLAILLDDSLFRAIRKVEVIEPDKDSIQGDIIPFMEIKSYHKDRLECEFHYHSTEPALPVCYLPSTKQLWECLDARNLRIRLEFSDADIFDSDMLDYLNTYPPSLIMPKGGIIMGRQYWKPNGSPGPLPEGCLKPFDWRGCEIKKETGKAKRGYCNIQDWVERKLRRETSDTTIIIKDDRKGEIADFIVIEPRKKLIGFYHCKAMHAKAPGDSVEDAYEVLGQACRSGIWVLSRKLMKEIYDRTQPTRNSPVVKGSASKLKNLVDSFRCNAWKYQVIVIQPGFKCDSVERSKKINPLLVATYEQLRASEAELIVWGS